MANNLGVVVAAAGIGSRMKSNISKQYLLLEQKPILAYSLQVFEACEAVKQIVVAVQPAAADYCQKEVIDKYGFKKITDLVAGGETRQQSVWQGLQRLAESNTIVAVHDGARPFVTPEMLARLLDAAARWGAAIPGVPVKDTIKVIDQQGFVDRTLFRDNLFAVQTPQLFTGAELRKAYRLAMVEGFKGTDDASVYEKYIGKVRVVEGEYCNIKITTPEDLVIAEGLMANSK